MTSQHFCGNLFIRNESLNAAHVQGEGIEHRCEYQEAENTENLLEAASHTQQS